MGIVISAGHIGIGMVAGDQHKRCQRHAVDLRPLFGPEEKAETFSIAFSSGFFLQGWLGAEKRSLQHRDFPLLKTPYECFRCIA